MWVTYFSGPVMWGHMSLMGPINLRYVAFITRAASWPALHELQDGTLKWGYKTSGSTNVWIWARSVPGELWMPWMRNKRRFLKFLTHQGSEWFSQSVVENRKFSLMGRNMSNWHYWYLVEGLELFMMVKSLFILYSQNGGEEGNMENSAPY